MRPLALEAGAAFVKVLPPATATCRLRLYVSTKEDSVALDNYTRRQKIMITALIVVIAAMFTVTGSLTYMLGESSKTPSKAGEMDGREYNYVEFHQRIRQGLNACTFLDYGQGQGDLKGIGRAGHDATGDDHPAGHRDDGDDLDGVNPLVHVVPDQVVAASDVDGEMAGVGGRVVGAAGVLTQG